PEVAVVRSVLVGGPTEAKVFALLHEPGGVDDVLGRDVVQHAELVVGAPLAPVLERFGLLQHVVASQSRHNRSPSVRVSSPAPPYLAIPAAPNPWMKMSPLGV